MIYFSSFRIKLSSWWMQFLARRTSRRSQRPSVLLVLLVLCRRTATTCLSLLFLRDLQLCLTISLYSGWGLSPDLNVGSVFSLACLGWLCKMMSFIFSSRTQVPVDLGLYCFEEVILGNLCFLRAYHTLPQEATVWNSALLITDFLSQLCWRARWIWDAGLGRDVCV